MPKTVLRDNDILRQEIGALADNDGVALAALMFNALTDGSLLGSVSAHAFDQNGKVTRAPFAHSGWFTVADTEAARSGLRFVVSQTRGVEPVLFRRQYSMLTTIHFGPRDTEEALCRSTSTS